MVRIHQRKGQIRKPWGLQPDPWIDHRQTLEDIAQGEKDEGGHRAPAEVRGEHPEYFNGIEKYRQLAQYQMSSASSYLLPAQTLSTTKTFSET